jgi:hypothetical protein
VLLFRKTVDPQFTITLQIRCPVMKFELPSTQAVGVLFEKKLDSHFSDGELNTAVAVNCKMQ